VKDQVTDTGKFKKIVQQTSDASPSSSLAKPIVTEFNVVRLVSVDVLMMSILTNHSLLRR
jgi:hypothetical protein